mmetsp:Transcript_36511/g.71806  ORF Transcript_36511/g.71806 Transcript_36511/m.71806 type:complete len:257 (-) Transcript_36511:7-777(-)
MQRFWPSPLLQTEHLQEWALPESSTLPRRPRDRGGCLPSCPKSTLCRLQSHTRCEPVRKRGKSPSLPLARRFFLEAVGLHSLHAPVVPEVRCPMRAVTSPSPHTLPGPVSVSLPTVCVQVPQRHKDQKPQHMHTRASEYVHAKGATLAAPEQTCASVSIRTRAARPRHEKRTPCDLSIKNLRDLKLRSVTKESIQVVGLPPERAPSLQAPKYLSVGGDARTDTWRQKNMSLVAVPSDPTESTRFRSLTPARSTPPS